MDNTGLVRYNYRTGDFSKADDTDFFLEIYEANNRGAQKNVTWLMSLIYIIADFFAAVKNSGILRWTEPLAKATSIAAPLCALPEAIGYGIRGVRSWVKWAEDATVANMKKAAATTLKMFQRCAESAYGMMKLGIFDAALSVVTKLGKDFLSCPLDLLKIGEAVKAEKQVMKETSDKVREIWEMENHYLYFQGVVGFAFHAMNCAAVLCATAVTFHMVTAMATLYTITVLGSCYYADERKDLQQKLAFERVSQEA